MENGMFKSIKLVLVAMLLLALTSFAQDNGKKNSVLHTFNFVIPIEHETWNVKIWMNGGETVEDDWNFWGLQLNWTRYLVSSKGFSSLVGVTAGYVKEYEGNVFNGFGFNAKYGWGYSFVLNKMTFAFHGVVGVDMKYLYYNDKDRGVWGKELDDYVISKVPVFDLFAGVDAFIDYRITEKIGVTASVDLTTNLLGRGKYYRSFYEKETDECYYKDHFTVYYWISGINVVPHVGVSYRF
jgi:hypothetical protein